MIMGWIKDLGRVIFPVTCEVCGRTLVDGERVLCLGCMAAMPRVNAHLEPEGELSRRLAGASKVRGVAAMFAYIRDTPYARVIQKSKYNCRPDIDHDLAMEFAAEIHGSGFFEGVDLILPVPMHTWKKLRRGFNQAEEIARGVGRVTGIELADNLVARRGHSTQTRRNAEERIRNAAGVYEVAYTEELVGKHVLLVDDVITTGATVMACCDALHGAVGTIDVSVLALAATRMA